MYEDDYIYSDPQPTALDWVRFAIGGIARVVVYACMLFIVGNAVAEAIRQDAWVLAFFELALLPLTFFIYPFVAAPDAMAWPLADGTSLTPFLVAALVAYPISTFVGGFAPIDR